MSIGCESRAGLRAHDQPGYDSPSVASGASEEPAFPELCRFYSCTVRTISNLYISLDNARLACMTGHNEDLEGNTEIYSMLKIA